MTCRFDRLVRNMRDLIALDADTGDVLGEAVRADVTVTFVARKRGFDLADGPGLCGRVVVAEIGIPRAFIEEAASG